MTFPQVQLESWRARVEKALDGKPFDKALVHATLEGIATAPLYVQAPQLPRMLGDGAPFGLCMRHEADTTPERVKDDLEGGADALWLPVAAEAALPKPLPPQVLALIDDDEGCRIGSERFALVSVLGDHLEGADAAEEIAIALAAAVGELTRGAQGLLVRVGVGRDTFMELCKLRALRLGLRKVLAAMSATPRLRIHAVASPRTVAARDPWVNMLRVTTEVFAAVLGGADLVTPLPFDEALTVHSALGQRIARNTGHVLREESGLGRVVDPAAGSYHLDTMTDALAREAWTRFQAIETHGGIERARESGFIAARVAAGRAARSALIAQRKLPVLGVSEFANLDEVLPSPPRHDPAGSWRDAAAFEALRDRTEASPGPRAQVLLRVLGPAAESRARVGFSSGFFAAAGFGTLELAEGEAPTPGALVCLCGSDERYAAEAVACAQALRAAGCRRVLLAGRPGALEPSLRDAGIEAFIYVGCDAVKVLGALVEVSP